MNRDEMKGKVDKAKGYIKEETGELTGNEELEAEGRAERAAGKARETMGKVERKAKNIGDELTKD